MENCIFCKVISHEIPAAIVYENEKVIAFLDLHPVNVGHTLLVPKDHYLSIYDTPDELMAAMGPALKKLAIAVKSAVSADGINIEMNNGPAAGQIVLHTHVHVVPRFNDDGFRHWRGARPYHEGELEEVRSKIQNSLS